MATALDNWEYLLSCQVCFEKFKEDGDHVPRILPCSHTLCQTCIAVLIAQNSPNKFECPECRDEHEAKQFPQNNDRLMLIRGETNPAQTNPTSVNLCPEHREKLNLFCKEPTCKKLICRKCLKIHDKHSVADADESVTHLVSVKTGFEEFGGIIELTGGHLAVLGLESGEWKLRVYDQTAGREQGSGKLKISEHGWDFTPNCPRSFVRQMNRPRGMTTVTLGGRETVAISYPFERIIEFRDTTDLNDIVHTHSVGPYCPGRLCTAGNSTLLYQDWSNDSNVHWLDCSGPEPKPAAGKNVTRTQQSWINGMCCVQNGDKQLLVTSGYRRKSSQLNGHEPTGVWAYNTETGLLEWSAEGAMPGMEMCAGNGNGLTRLTTDGHGHLFVCDGRNRSIHMLSVDGTYLGPLLKEGEHDLGDPQRVQWSETTSSLIVGHNKDGECFISVVNVQCLVGNEQILIAKNPGILKLRI